MRLRAGLPAVAAEEVERAPNGALVNSYCGLIDRDHADAYAGQCKMS